MSPKFAKNAALHGPEKPGAYSCEMEKQLMIDNMLAAIEIFGKDRLREVFKYRKIKTTEHSHFYS